MGLQIEPRVASANLLAFAKQKVSFLARGVPANEVISFVRDMPIIYSLVARGSNVLAEFTSTTGNFTTITRRILTKIPPQNNQMSYVYDKSDQTCAQGAISLFWLFVIDMFFTIS